MDQRYYSVSSAAEFLAEELCGRTVTIEREKKTVTTRVTVNREITETNGEGKRFILTVSAEGVGYEQANGTISSRVQPEKTKPN